MHENYSPTTVKSDRLFVKFVDIGCMFKGIIVVIVLWLISEWLLLSSACSVII